MAKVDNQTVQIGDFVSFKSDVEQYGKIVKIQGDTLTLFKETGFNGDYIGGHQYTTVSAKQCWLD